MPPQRPAQSLEKLAIRLFLTLSPRFPHAAQPAPPDDLRPWESVDVARAEGEGPGTIPGTWYPADGRPRGAVLLLPPWSSWGKAYFHRRGRIEALRAAGYHALTLDLPGTPGLPAQGFFDRDIEAGLTFLHERAPDLPLHLWGVSAGGYWAHPVLARTSLVSGAIFEDVAAHLIDWSWRVAPWGRPAYLFFKHVLRPAYRYLDMRQHLCQWRKGPGSAPRRHLRARRSRERPLPDRERRPPPGIHPARQRGGSCAGAGYVPAGGGTEGEREAHSRTG